jgi:hypothetical protein
MLIELTIQNHFAGSFVKSVLNHIWPSGEQSMEAVWGYIAGFLSEHLDGYTTFDV